LKLCEGSSGRNVCWSLSLGVAVLSVFVFTLMITFVVTFPSHSALYNPFSAVLMVQGSTIILSEKNQIGLQRIIQTHLRIFTTKLHINSMLLSKSNHS